MSFSAREITTQVPAGVPLRGVTTIARLQRRWLSADLQRLRFLPER